MAELSRIDFRDFVVREVGYAAGHRMPRHAHDFSNVTAVISGEMEEIADAGEHCGRSCSVLLKPAGTMHSNYWMGRRGTRCISVEFRFGNGPELAWQWIEDAATARTVLALTAALRGSSREDVETHARSFVATAISAATATAGEAPPWLADVKRTLDAHFDEPLRFDALARDHGLHPVYLSRAFHRHTGVAMSEYVRSLRLRHARHLLSATERPLAAVSADAGFADASHLCRVFAESHGLTPRAFRTLTRI
ncbi:MAG TPA: helix-turn-helix domain-containing protein [Thermoanaerobaculia bacterium]|jgi:AraC family transcriptional regulator